MKGDLLPLDSSLRDAASRLYPQVVLSERARFMPMLELEKGEISSTAAIEVARVTREKAQEVAQKLIALLPQPAHAEWRSDLGYIVLREAPAEFLIPQVRLLAETFPRSAASPQPRDVIVLTPDATVPLYARLRLVAVAALQALLTAAYEGSCRLMISPRPAVLITSRAELLGELGAAVQALVAEGSPARPDPLSLLATASPCRTTSPCRITVVAAHHYHDTLPQPTKAKLGELKLCDAISLRMPGDGWLISRDRALPEILSAASLRRVVEQLSSEDGWLRWLFHAVSSVPSGDYDPMVALFDECASPLWSVRMLHERFVDLVGAGRISGLRPEITQLPASQRELLLRSLFLPAWCGRAVEEGEVLGWMMVVERLASQGHAFLNTPETRRAIGAGALSGPEAQILAGLGFGLSSILPVVF